MGAFRQWKINLWNMGNTNSLLEKALQIAVKAHSGQIDKAGSAYIFHPIRVSNRCSTDDERIVALLHDTIEDTEVTAEYLLMEGFPRNIVDAILSVTRNEDESYDDFIKRSRLNPIGRQVKLHDLEDNMDITRLNELTEKDIYRLNKYIKAYKYLKE
uniref:(P)ppGpp synthetase, RelA/SpoT family n=1 Tax=Siphoviridae sp. ctJe739 TaxID=2826241 RepID=A0A8S5N7G3_9CAUD|nr:MAG TPA: (p)ppGpp synthetase, RelA/SpoT family [Siphoviridae sp. ctJe739]DAZ65405.1 MAG TPA: (p)ppGpp synthetase, RelA/SpoT family [Caudoviricetes sp.]